MNAEGFSKNRELPKAAVNLCRHSIGPLRGVGPLELPETGLETSRHKQFWDQYDSALVDCGLLRVIIICAAAAGDVDDSGVDDDWTCWLHYISNTI